MGYITELFRYPVKGLSAEPLSAVNLVEGAGFPYDRCMALTNGEWQFRLEDYSPRSKLDFLALINHPKLALWRTRFDESSRTLHVGAPGEAMQSVELDASESMAAFSLNLCKYLDLSPPNPPTLVVARQNEFADVAVIDPQLKTFISLINLATVRQLEETMSAEVDPLRFRANIYIDGVAPWEEMSWLGKTVMIGEVQFRCTLRTRRCAVTSVDPKSGEKNIGVVQALVSSQGHQDLGVYLTAEGNGRIQVGDSLQAPNADQQPCQFTSKKWNGVTFKVFSR